VSLQETENAARGSMEAAKGKRIRREIIISLQIERRQQTRESCHCERSH
jgi:hypothetical protein